MGQKIKIDVDPDLREFMIKYLHNRHSDLARLRTCLEAGDLEGIRNVSHKIRGHAMSYGMAPLGEICKKMESAAKEGKSGEITTLINEYTEYLQCVELP